MTINGEKVEPGRGPEARGAMLKNHGGTISPRKLAFDQKPERRKATGSVDLDPGRKISV